MADGPHAGGSVAMKALVLLAIRVALGGIFLYSGIIKAGSGEQFAVVLAPFTILPPAWIGAFAIALPWTEVAAGLLILLPRVHRAGAAIVVLLCGVFIAALAWALASGLIVDCGCFGPDDTPSAGKMVRALGRDVVLLLLAAAVMVSPKPDRRI